MHARVTSKSLVQKPSRMSSHFLWPLTCACDLHRQCMAPRSRYDSSRHSRSGRTRVTRDTDRDDLHTCVERGCAGLTHTREHACECALLFLWPRSYSRVSSPGRLQDVTKVVVDSTCKSIPASFSKVHDLSSVYSIHVHVCARTHTRAQMQARVHAHTHTRCNAKQDACVMSADGNDLRPC